MTHVKEIEQYFYKEDEEARKEHMKKIKGNESFLESKILLVRPPSAVAFTTVPIGLLYIASYLRSRGFKNIKILDGRIDKMDFQDFKKTMDEFKPDFVGISSMTYEGRYAHAIAGMAKEVNPNVHVYIGGPHANTFTHGILNDPNIDACVLGEGELTLEDLIINSENLSKVEGIAFRKGKDIIVTKERTFLANLDDMPLPAYDMIDMEKYFKGTVVHGHIYKSRRLVSIFTSRACPFGCIYCHKIFGRRFRARSPENILKEIKLLYEKYNVKEIHIEDDVFNIQIDRAKKTMDLIIESGMKIAIQFPNGIRADLVDEELLAKMKKAGVYRICYGVETANPETQWLIDKGLDLNKVVEAVKMTRKAGINVHGFFMIGFPDETEAQMKKTIDFAKGLDLCTADFSKVVPFPGTMMYKVVKDMGKKLEMDTNKFHLHNQAINLSVVEQDKLNKMYKNAYMGFYMSPKRFWWNFRTSPNKMVFFKYIIRFMKFTIKPQPIGIDRELEARLENFANKYTKDLSYGDEPIDSPLLKYYSSPRYLEMSRKLK